MRIAIDYTSAIAQSAGIGRYTRSLIDTLVRLRVDEEYLLFSSESPTVERPFPRDDAVESRVIGLGGRAIGNRRLTILWQRLRLPLPVEMLAGRADVLHGPDFTLPPSLGMPGVVTIHDLAYLMHPQYAVPALARYLSAVVPPTVQRAAAIIAVSEHTANDIIEHYGVRREKIKVIAPGVDASFAPVTDQRALATIDARYRLEHPLVLAVGTIEPRKRYDHLIAAFAQARQQPDGPRMLAIAGRRGWLYEPTVRAAQEHHVSDAVRFLDYAPETDLAGLYSTADILAMPSAYEGFGIPVIEAMACGTPVICSDGGSLPEVAGDAALIVPTDDDTALVDAMRMVLGDAARREQMRIRGLARAAQFTWEQTARQHLAVYQQVAAESNKRKR